MRKQLLLAMSILSGTTLFADDALSGSAKLACEAILCLSSGTRPSECTPSLDQYFSISAEKWSDTIAKRKSFLQLCPVGGADVDDLAFADLRDNVLTSADPRQCTPEALNTKIERSGKDDDAGYRINPNMPGSCSSLINHAYTDIKMPTYTCSSEFYSPLEWSISAKLLPISAMEYRGLSEGDRHIIEDSEDTFYYRKTPINKNCWTY